MDVSKKDYSFAQGKWLICKKVYIDLKGHCDVTTVKEVECEYKLDCFKERLDLMD